MNRLILILAAMLIVSCASSSKGFKPSSLKEDEVIVFGRFKLSVENDNLTKACDISIRGAEGTRALIDLDKSGLFIGKIKRGNAKIGMWACRDGIHHHIIRLERGSINFDIPKGARKVYFGDVDIEFDSTFHPGLLLLGGAGAALAGGEVEGLHMITTDNLDKTLEEYNKAVDKKDNYKVEKIFFKDVISKKK